MSQLISDNAQQQQQQCQQETQTTEGRQWRPVFRVQKVARDPIAAMLNQLRSSQFAPNSRSFHEATEAVATSILEALQSAPRSGVIGRLTASQRREKILKLWQKSAKWRRCAKRGRRPRGKSQCGPVFKAGLPTVRSGGQTPTVQDTAVTSTGRKQSLTLKEERLSTDKESLLMSKTRTLPIISAPVFMFIRSATPALQA